jgi:DNA-binding Lrp family transcriptional regulator
LAKSLKFTGDFLLTVIARDGEHYQQFVLDRLAKLPSVATYRSTLIMRVVKHTTECSKSAREFAVRFCDAIRLDGRYGY